MSKPPVIAQRSATPFGRFWLTASGFWRGRSARVAWSLAALLVFVVVLQLVVQYRLNLWNRDFFNALGRRDHGGIWAEARLFLPLVACSIALAVLAVWGRMTCQRRWRGWLTAALIDRWISTGGYRQIDLVGGEHQNAEYRIAEDARVATDAPVDFAVGLLTSLLVAITFISVLWNVGGQIAVEALGQAFVLPGYLVVAVVAYSALTTIMTVVIGRRMVDVAERKNQAESELRYTAAHLRESALNGNAKHMADGVELGAALRTTLSTWRELTGQHMRTTVISHGNTLLAPVIGLILCAPKYLAGTMSLGEVTQAAAAFVAVQTAFNWLVDNYPRLSDWMSSVNRVARLLYALDELARRAAGPAPDGPGELAASGQ
ncbi:MAG: ABC transporter [Alphaproteobacteria bacterium]|nr:ABC transporter [Alphaproteobacteria bacterium]